MYISQIRPTMHRSNNWIKIKQVLESRITSRVLNLGNTLACESWHYNRAPKPDLRFKDQVKILRGFSIVIPISNLGGSLANLNGIIPSIRTNPTKSIRTTYQ